MNNKMNNKPICGEWHSNDVMPVDEKTCIFKINVYDEEEVLVGCRRGDEILRINDYDDFVCETDDIIRWCYIDLN